MTHSILTPVHFYLFRHGETDWNRVRRFQGHTDIPLNDLGRSQAKELAAELIKLPLEVILTSDLKRARETTQIVNAEFKLPVFELPALRECKLGDPDGMYRDKIVEKYGAPMWDRWLSVHPDDLNFGFPNGETKSDHLNRLILSLKIFSEKNPQFKHIAISTHGGSVRRLVHHCDGAPSEAIPLPNCALYQISYDPDQKSWQYQGPLPEHAKWTTPPDSNVWGKS